jgi:tryptophan-rich sensory protein
MMAVLDAHLNQILVAVAAVVVVAFAGGLTTDVGPWYESLRFPTLRPPNWLFAPAWTVIFAFTAASGVLAWNDAPDDAARRTLIGLFALNGLLNVAWSPLFFKLRRPDWAFIELIPFWLSILALILLTSSFSPRAAGLLAPYLVWVTFAGWLNWQIVRLNAPFGRTAARKFR